MGPAKAARWEPVLGLAWEPQSEVPSDLAWEPMLGLPWDLGSVLPSEQGLALALEPLSEPKELVSALELGLAWEVPSGLAWEPPSGPRSGVPSGVDSVPPSALAWEARTALRSGQQ